MKTKSLICFLVATVVASGCSAPAPAPPAADLFTDASGITNTNEGRRRSQASPGDTVKVTPVANRTELQVSKYYNWFVHADKFTPDKFILEGNRTVAHDPHSYAISTCDASGYMFSFNPFDRDQTTGTNTAYMRFDGKNSVPLEISYKNETAYMKWSYRQMESLHNYMNATRNTIAVQQLTQPLFVVDIRKSNFVHEVGEFIRLCAIQKKQSHQT